MMHIKNYLSIFVFIFSTIFFAYLPCTAVNRASFDYDLSKLQGCENTVRILIIGSGPGGLSAGIAAARAGFKPYIVTGPTIGGLLTGSTEVENMPGVVSAPGADIMDIIHKQAQKFGAEFVQESVTQVDFSRWPFMVQTESGLSFNALSVIISTGSRPRLLGVPGESKYWGAGVSACAVCDGFMYEGGKVAIVGGGDSAVNHALDLVPYAADITIFVRKNRMRAVQSMRNQLDDYQDKIHVVYNKKITEVLGDGDVVTGLQIEDTLTGEQTTEQFDGLFLAIGHEPNTRLFESYLELDTGRYIYLDSRSQETSVRGIFSAGDVSSPRYRQAPKAAAEGLVAAFEAIDFLREIGLTEKTFGNFYSK